MSQEHRWNKARHGNMAGRPSGFERTLSPNDPAARADESGWGSVVRDNREAVTVGGARVAADADTISPVSSAFGETPVSGIVRRRRELGLPKIPVARITRDEDDTATGVPSELVEAEAPLDPMPDFASEYVPPQPLPPVAQHKTFELAAVQLDPAIHPRTAATLVNARTSQRRDEKRRKDARDVELLLAQSQRRRRGPWLAVAFLLLVGLGFGVGSELMRAPEAGAEPMAPEHEARPAEAAGVPATRALPVSGKRQAKQVEVSRGEAQPNQPVAVGRSLGAPGHASELRSAAQRPPASTHTPSEASRRRLPSDEEPRPTTSSAKPRGPEREVWLE